MPDRLAEDDLVVWLARLQPSASAGARCRSFPGDEGSWATVLARATSYGVLPLIARNLERLGSSRVPAPIAAKLWSACRANAAHSAMLAYELRSVLRILGRAGVPVIPLKGVALSESLYGDVTLRVCSDLDILVPRSMVERSLDALGTMDYRPEFSERVVLDLALRHDIECSLTRSGHGIAPALDLHWGIAWGGARDAAAANELWDAAREARFQGVPMLALSREWEVLFLALHAARHRWQGLKWLVDVHEACLRGGIDWGDARATAARFGWEEPLRITLFACQALLGTPIPEGFGSRGLPRWLTLLSGGPQTPDNWRDGLFPVRLLRPPSQKIRYLARLLFAPTPAEYRLVRLPSCLRRLYYALRPLRLSAKYAWTVARAGLGGGRSAVGLH